MKKIYSVLFAALCFMGVTSCDSLDLSSPSSIDDAGYWKSADHFKAFNNGVTTLFRNCQNEFFVYGESRSGFYGGSPFGGEATQGMENLFNNTLSNTRTGVSNYGGFYTPINQINLLIAKTEETSVISEADKNYYLGAAYGMRAYLYFHLLRSYGDAIIYTTYTSGSTLDLSNVVRGQDPAADVLAQIKSDIAASESAFGNNYAFTKGKNFWSLGATKMLKGEVYLWSGKQMGGGTSDYQTAKTALQEVANCPSINLLDDYANIFKYSNKKNNEIIFSLYNGEGETVFMEDQWRMGFVPQQAYMNDGKHYNEAGENVAETKDAEINGLIRMPLKTNIYDQLYLDNDLRKRNNLRAVYYKQDSGEIEYIGTYAYKYQGVMMSGSSVRSWYDDFIIYRYGDCLLLLAEAKYLLGEDIATEINTIRKRAYGENYSDAVAYPNDKGDFYADNEFVGSDEDPAEAILKERLRELIFEGKRWYDIRLLNATDKYSLATSDRLLWPIDQSTLTNNKELKQTPGY